MEVIDAVSLMSYLVRYCAPPALIINLTAWAVSVAIGAMTGRGLKLDGRIR